MAVHDSPLEKGWARVVHLVECVQRGTVKLTSEDVFDPTNGRYNYQTALSYVIQQATQALGLPFPAQDKTMAGGEMA